MYALSVLRSQFTWHVRAISTAGLSVSRHLEARAPTLLRRDGDLRRLLIDSTSSHCQIVV